MKEQVEAGVYHLRINSDLPYANLSLCNQKSSQSWRKYRKESFQRGMKYSVDQTKYTRIEGTRCKRCLKILEGRN